MALALANFVQTTNATILDRIDEIITVWLSALGETEESATGEYVHVIRNQNGPHLLQHADTREHPTSTRITGPPQVSASTLHITTFGPVHSPTVSTSSLEESAIVPCSQTSSSANSSYGTSQTSSPSTPLDNMVKSYDSIHGCGENYEKVLADWGPGVAALTMRKHDGDRSGSTCWDADATFRTDNATFAIPSPSIYDTTRTDDFDYANNDDTPVVNSTSHFSNNSIFEHNGTRYDGTLPADAGHGDDNDNHDNDNDNDDDDYYYYNMYQSKRSADCYYNNDEQDDELNLERGWEADGWGADPAAESKQVPEDARFKNVGHNCLISCIYHYGLMLYLLAFITAHCTRSSAQSASQRHHFSGPQQYCQSQRRHAAIPQRLSNASKSRCQCFAAVSRLAFWSCPCRRLGVLLRIINLFWSKPLDSKSA